MKWHTAEISEIKILQECAEKNDFQENNYSALNCLLYQEKYMSKICMENNWIFERYEHCGKFCFSFPHNINADYSSVSDALKLLENQAKEASSPLFFHNINAREKEILTEVFPDITIEKDDSLGDYIYLTENLANLPGSKYSKKRNHINQFKKKHENFRFELLSEENLFYVEEIENAWLLENLSDDEKERQNLEEERKIIKKALENFTPLSKDCAMTGGLLFTDGKAQAFCIASRLSREITDVHFEKCRGECAGDGGYAVINNEFSKTVKTRLLNREEDLGIEGLRKAKLSYYPEKVLEKFFAKL